MKRIIISSYIEYTDFISESVPSSVQVFLDAEDPDYSTTKRAYDSYMRERKMFPSDRSVDSLDIIYDQDHKRFYNKYRPFADKCKELYNNSHPSGYGRNDYESIRRDELLRAIDFNFPYGWR